MEKCKTLVRRWGEEGTSLAGSTDKGTDKNAILFYSGRSSKNNKHFRLYTADLKVQRLILGRKIVNPNHSRPKGSKVNFRLGQGVFQPIWWVACIVLCAQQTLHSTLQWEFACDRQNTSSAVHYSGHHYCSVHTPHNICYWLQTVTLCLIVAGQEKTFQIKHTCEHTPI